MTGSASTSKRRLPGGAVAWALAAAVAAPLSGQAVDTPEPGSAEAISAATTEARFLSPWVASVPDHPTIPSPRDFLGHQVGTPGELHDTRAIYAYYRALAAATPRVQVESLGRSEEGREFLLVIVGDEAALRGLAAARGAMAELADPRRCDEACAAARIPGLRPFYMLHGGLHSRETGPPEMLMELVYRLAVSEAPLAREVREKLVVLVNPVAEPDGRDRMVEWFYRHLKGKTDYDALPPVSPPYWGRYVRHDNNRDGVQRKLALTRATQDAFLKWLPLVLHDLHESVPLLATWTGTGPYNTNLEPSVFSEWHSIAFHEVATLTGLGLPGVWTYGFGEGFAHLYADSVAINHNAIGRGYETFGNGTAETVERLLEPEHNRYTGRPVTERDWYRMVPPPKRFKWSLRDNTNYMETGVLAALQYVARNAPEMLWSFYRRGASAVRRGREEKPFAVAIPESQVDRRRLARLVNLLREHGIEVRRAEGAFKTAEGEFAAGTYLVRLDQPYRGWAVDLLLPQKYPIDKAPFPAYDDVSWSLPVSLGVEVRAIEDPAVRDVAAPLLPRPVSYAGGVRGDGPVYLLRDQGQEALLAARVALRHFQVKGAHKAFSAGGRDYPAGSWVLAPQAGLRTALEGVAARLALDFDSAALVPDVPRHELDLPRLAVLQTWADTQSAGWIRMHFDQQAVPYTLVVDEDVRRGGLRARFDVLLFPDTGRSLKDLIGGLDPQQGPLAYTRTERFPSHGSPASSADITGGLTWAGVQNLESFVREGGLLVTLGGASTLPLDGGLVRDVRRAAGKDVYIPGSELRTRFRRPEHPLAYGYPESGSAMREDGPLYEVRRADRGRIVLQWGTRLPRDDDGEEPPAAEDREEKKTPLVVSGGVKGAAEIEGKPAILDVPIGRGRVLAFDFDPIHRLQTESEFRLVWNAILNWNDWP